MYWFLRIASLPYLSVPSFACGRDLCLEIRDRRTRAVLGFRRLSQDVGHV